MPRDRKGNGIRVLLVDDHPIVLRGLCDLFAVHKGFQVVGQETDSERVLGAVRELRPDVVVLDLMMPGQSGMETIAQLVREEYSPRIVVLSMHANIAYVWEALRSGAIGYVLKCAGGEELIAAVRCAARGQRYLSAGISEPEVSDYTRRAKGTVVDPYDMLTRRERQVLQLIAEGQTNAQIATDLGLSVRTIETHRSHLMRKLALHNHAELLRYAIGRGIILP